MTLYCQILLTHLSSRGLPPLTLLFSGPDSVCAYRCQVKGGGLIIIIIVLFFSIDDNDNKPVNKA